MPVNWRHGGGFLNDPTLARLIQRAAAGNTEVRETVSNVREARLRRLSSRSSLCPNLETAGSARKSHQDEADGVEVDTELYSALIHTLNIISPRKILNLPASPVPAVTAETRSSGSTKIRPAGFFVGSLKAGGTRPARTRPPTGSIVSGMHGANRSSSWWPPER